MQKILIVDDEQIMLKISSKILSKEYETICANSGEEAIELFLREKPDLVLSDLLMPGIDGYELQKILQEKSSEPVPIMFMTADESDESEVKGFRLGAADYIRKPLKADVLLRRVKNVLDNFDKIQDLTEAANLDPMTKLFNKTAAQREISKLCETSQGVLMLLDLDSFKLVNDLYGHAIGDKILVRFAELIKGVIRSTDVAGRIGGDEFLAFCQNVQDEKIIFNKVNFLNQQLLVSAKNFMGADMNIPLGTSVGAVFVPDAGRDFNALTEKADKALYQVKHHGKHGCRFFSDDYSTNTAKSKNISQTQMILSERNKEQGAYYVDFEKFKAIYQFMARLNDDFQTASYFLEITLDTDNDKTREEFLEVLRKNLRRSDCLTKSRSGQFLVLLNDSSPEKINVLEKIIAATWQTKNLGGEINFELGKLS